MRDGGGLFLLVKPNGLKHWQFRYMKPDGREGLFQIGPYLRVTLDANPVCRHSQGGMFGIAPYRSTSQLKAKNRARPT